MRLATPNFKNKMAATVWMLFLALALVLVDYFLAEVQAIAGWDVEKLDLVQKNSILLQKGLIKSSSSCLSQNGLYQVNEQQQLFFKDKSSQKVVYEADVGGVICTPSGEVFFTQLSAYQGGLWVYSLGEKKKILSHLHQVADFYLTSSGQLYLVEEGRELLFKVFRKK